MVREAAEQRTADQLADGVYRNQQPRAKRSCAEMLGVERQERIHDGHPQDVHHND
jgi:hypothetical protein